MYVDCWEIHIDLLPTDRLDTEGEVLALSGLPGGGVGPLDVQHQLLADHRERALVDRFAEDEQRAMPARGLVGDVGERKTGVGKDLEKVGVVLVDVDDDAVVLDMQLIARGTAVLKPDLRVVEPGGLGPFAGFIQEGGQAVDGHPDHDTGANARARQCDRDWLGSGLLVGCSCGAVPCRDVFANGIEP